MKNHTYIFVSSSGQQIAFELWETGEVTMMERPAGTNDIWSPKSVPEREEGDPVQIAFEREGLDDLFVQAGVTRDYCVVHESRRFMQSNYCEKSIPEGYEGRECRFGER